MQTKLFFSYTLLHKKTTIVIPPEPDDKTLLLKTLRHYVLESQNVEK